VARSEFSVAQLVNMIERGELQLPEMQRRYVWRSTRVRDLLDSLYRGYPSGVVLTWQTNEEVDRNEFAVETGGHSFGRPMLLLDGQQRLTSLSAVIRGVPVTVRGRKRPIDILFNLDHPEGVTIVTEVQEDDDNDDESTDEETDLLDEEDALQRRMQQRTFVVSSKSLASLPNWVSVSSIFASDDDTDVFLRAGIQDLRDPRRILYTQRLNRLRAIRDYMYRVDVLEDTMSYEEVTEIFVRVNSLGAKLRSSDLALAQITAKWRGSLKEFQDFQKQCDHLGFRFDLGPYLKALVAVATGQSRFLTVGSLTQQTLQDAWTRTTKAMTFAINYLRTNTGIDSPALLASPFVLITLAFWGDRRNYNVSPEESAAMRRWTLLANAKGRYSRGSSETLLDQDLATLRDGGGPDQLVDRLVNQVGRLAILPEDLAGRTSRSALFKTMFLAFRDAGAHDWQSNLRISVNHSGSADKLQFHHVFPRAFLKKSIPHIKQGQIDDIANLAFIGGSTNRNISAKDPAVYIPALIADGREQELRCQDVPTEVALLDSANYEDFLIARRLLIADRLNRFLATDQS
jgi:hypothetical protein